MRLGRAQCGGVPSYDDTNNQYRAPQLGSTRFSKVVTTAKMIAEFGQRKRSFLAHCGRSIPPPFKVSFASNAFIQQAYGVFSGHHADRNQRLPTRDCPCGHNRQFQSFAQCDQILIAWPCPTLLPKIDARLADAGAVSHISDRQAAFYPSIAEMTVQANFSGQFGNPLHWFALFTASSSAE
jgi:hypothetical protein